MRWYTGYITTAEKKGVVCDWVAQLVLGPPAPMLYVTNVSVSLASCSLPGSTSPVCSLYIITLNIQFSFTCCTGASQ